MPQSGFLSLYQILNTCFRKVGIAVTQNPDDFVKQETAVDIQLLPENVTFSKWKRVTMIDNKQRIRIVQEELKKEEIVDLWNEEVRDFRGHIQKVQTQYAKSQLLKQNLPKNEVIVHMDLSETIIAKEIQSAYWNQSTVTLYPNVAFYTSPENDEIKHKSYVLSDSGTPTHSSSTVLAILHKFFDIGISEKENIKHVHYWTDSPTSQYRNRFFFHTIANHIDMFGLMATWNYFEAGHGKVMV